MMQMVFNRLLMFFFLAVAVLSCKVTDEESPDPSEVFVKYFGSSGSHSAVDLIYNSSKEEYLLLGIQNKAEIGSAAETSGDFYFITVDKDGNEIGSSVIDIFDSLSNDVPKRIKQIDDDTYLFVGSSTTNKATYIVWGRITHDLEIVDNTIFHIESNRAYTGSFLDAADINVVASDPTKVVIFGTTDTKETGDLSTESQRQFFLAKGIIGSDSLIWRKSLGDQGDDIAKSFFETSSGGFLLFGETQTTGQSIDSAAQSSVALGTNVLVLGTTSLGGPDMAEGVFGLTNSNQSQNEAIGSVLSLGSGGYAILGSSLVPATSTSFTYLIFVDGVGNLRSSTYRSGILENEYGNGSTSIPSKGYALARTFDGGLIALGSYNAFQEGEDLSTSRLEEVMVMKTTPFGEVIPEYNDYYGFVTGNDRANAAITLPDGKVATLCTFDFGSGSTLIGLMKLNANGQLKP